MCLDQGPQRSGTGEAWTRDPSVSSQALYHWATALPILFLFEDVIDYRDLRGINIKSFVSIGLLVFAAQ